LKKHKPWFDEEYSKLLHTESWSNCYIRGSKPNSDNLNKVKTW